MTFFRLLIATIWISLLLANRADLQGQESQSAIVTPELTSYPLDLAVAADGSVYVVDLKMHGVWKWKDDTLTEFFRGSPKFRTPLNAPRSIAIDKDGSVLVGDSATWEIFRFSKDGQPQPITSGKIGIPIDMAVASDGTIYAADLQLRKVVRIRPGKSEVEEVADLTARGIFVDAKDRVWVVCPNEPQLVVIEGDDIVTPIVSQRVFNFPHQVVVNAAGDAFVTDNYEHCVWKVTAGVTPTKWSADNAVDNPVGITLVDDLPVVVDSRRREVIKFDADGKPTVWFKIATN